MDSRTYFMDPDQTTINVYITLTKNLEEKLKNIGIIDIDICTEKLSGKYPELAKYKHIVDVCFLNDDLIRFERLMKDEGYTEE